MLRTLPAFLLIALTLDAQPQVLPDKRVTFRYRAPNAKEVALAREGSLRVPMTKDAEGVWSATVGPLEPDWWGYTFQVDGVATIDPANPVMKPNLLGTTSMVHVPGDGLPWDPADVPRGMVHRHFYHSKIVGDDRDYYVYTPPGYTAKSEPLPVLYLLHGFSDDARGWTSVGQAHVILDNLIAQGKAKPMLVVMPLGYGAPEIVTRTAGGMRDPSLRTRNMERFRDALLNEMIPQVEKEYRASKRPIDRAIAGLSMGGAETLFTGLNATDRFAWIGSFSAGGLGDDLGAAFPKLDASVNARVKLLWIACGVDDRLIEANRKVRDHLKSKDVKHTFLETPGAHTWLVWRRYLAQFTPMLFR